MKTLLKCANGDGNPICPPSKVICRQCMDKIISNLEEYIIGLQQQKILITQNTDYAICSYKYTCEHQKVNTPSTYICKEPDFDCAYKQYVKKVPQTTHQRPEI